MRRFIKLAVCVCLTAVLLMCADGFLSYGELCATLPLLCITGILMDVRK